MGKSKNVLQKARKEYFKSLENKNDENTKEDDDDDDEDEQLYETRAENKIKFINAVNEIRTNVFSYVRESGIPLCEYLNRDNIVNYLKWLKS